jgi:4-diphosphocytidyl-2-C-methyl-D-erythritol kinase
MVFLHENFKMVIFPKAKINIGLRITGRRNDGYHDLQTIFYPVQLSDALEFVINDDQSGPDILTTSGLAVNCETNNNLIIKALHLLRKKYPIPCLLIHLHKKIPLGAGLGGGSSDAAFFLKALNRHFNLEIEVEDLKRLSLSVGSDCPFFIECIPSYAEGRGEELTGVKPLPVGLQLVLVNPGINISTSEAYSGCIPYKSSSGPADHYEMDISEWKETMVNDFEKTVFSKYPRIAVIKETLYDMGAVYSSMSGSGSSVYGIFRDPYIIPEKLESLVIYSGSL